MGRVKLLKLAGLALPPILVLLLLFWYQQTNLAHPPRTVNLDPDRTLAIPSGPPADFQVSFGPPTILLLDSRNQIIQVERTSTEPQFTVLCRYLSGDPCVVNNRLLAVFEQLRPQLAPGTGVVYRLAGSVP